MPVEGRRLGGRQPDLEEFFGKRIAAAKERYCVTQPEVLTLEEAATYLRVHPRTLRLKATEGVVPGAKVGRVWRFHKQQLEEWLLQGGGLNANRSLP